MTPSIPIQLALGAALLGLSTLIGCEAAPPTTLTVNLAPEPPENTTFVGTTQPVRDYDRSVAFVANGDTVASSTGVRYQTKPDTHPILVPAAETGVFIANLATAPYTFHEQRGPVVSSGFQFPPSHTLMPPLPPPPAAAAAPQLTPENVAPTEPDSPATDGPPSMPPDTGAPIVNTNIDASTPAAVDILSPTTTQPEAAAFTIAGQVVRPGDYVVVGEPKLSEIVLAARPASEDAAKVAITVTRSGEEPATTTLSQLQSGAVEDIVIKAGDTITIAVNP